MRDKVIAIFTSLSLNYRAKKGEFQHSFEYAHLLPSTKSPTFLFRYEIRDPHLVEENVLQILKERADFDNYKPRPFNMREFYDRTGHDIKDMLLSCFYRGMECSAENFKVVSQACQSLAVAIWANWGMPAPRCELAKNIQYVIQGQSWYSWFSHPLCDLCWTIIAWICFWVLKFQSFQQLMLYKWISLFPLKKQVFLCKLWMIYTEGWRLLSAHLSIVTSIHLV